MKTRHVYSTEVLPDLGAASVEAWSAGDFDLQGKLEVEYEILEDHVALLERILESPKLRNAAKFVVRCPRGHPMGRVYVVKNKAVFVSLVRFDGSNVGGFAGSAARHPSSADGFSNSSLVEQAVRYIDFIYDSDNSVPLRAQCDCRYGLISRQWLLHHFAEGKHGATWQGWEWYSELADETP